MKEIFKVLQVTEDEDGNEKYRSYILTGVAARDYKIGEVVESETPLFCFPTLETAIESVKLDKERGFVIARGEAERIYPARWTWIDFWEFNDLGESKKSEETRELPTKEDFLNWWDAHDPRKGIVPNDETTVRGMRHAHVTYKLKLTSIVARLG